MWAKLAEFGLICKDPEHLENGVWVLSSMGARQTDLETRSRDSRRSWHHHVMNCFLLVQKTLGHLPVCRWLHSAAGVIKCRASAVTKGWDNKTTDIPLACMMQGMIVHVCRDDLVRGDWCIDREEINAWVWIHYFNVKSCKILMLFLNYFYFKRNFFNN